MGHNTGSVVSVSKSPEHTFSKKTEEKITLVTGQGVEGDAHFGKTVQHLSRVSKAPEKPNLRQVHLIHKEIIDELEKKGLKINPGDIGENIITSGIDLLGLPTGARLKIGKEAVVEITGLRDPCKQLDQLHDGLMKAFLDRDSEGKLIRKSGVMGIVVSGGDIRKGDDVLVTIPEGPLEPLKVV